MRARVMRASLHAKGTEYPLNICSIYYTVYYRRTVVLVYDRTLRVELYDRVTRYLLLLVQVQVPGTGTGVYHLYTVGKVDILF